VILDGFLMILGWFFDDFLMNLGVFWEAKRSKTQVAKTVIFQSFGFHLG